MCVLSTTNFAQWFTTITNIKHTPCLTSVNGSVSKSLNKSEVVVFKESPSENVWDSAPDF